MSDKPVFVRNISTYVDNEFAGGDKPTHPAIASAAKFAKLEQIVESAVDANLKVAVLQAKLVNKDAIIAGLEAKLEASQR